MTQPSDTYLAEGWRCGLFGLFLLLLCPASLAAQSRSLTCAVIEAPFDYTLDDLHGPRVAFDLEFCHAVALALGPGMKVVPLAVPDEAAALHALRTGKADMIPTLSETLSHAADPELALTPPILLDGVGLLVPSTVPSAQALAGRKICFFAETDTEVSLHTWFRLQGLDFLPYPFSEEGEMQAAFSADTCPAVAGDLTRLAAVRAGLTHPESAKILPETLAPEPLSAATRRSDPKLTRVVLAVEQLLLNADALDVRRATLAAALTSADPAILRLLGRTHELGPAAGLDDGWPGRVLGGVGSYSDLAHRTLTLPLAVPPALPLR